MVNLDLSHDQNDTPLTFAKIEVYNPEFEIKDFSDSVHISLNRWSPKTDLPYDEFT